MDLDYGKMCVVLDGFKELTLDTTVEFKGGEFYEEEEVPVSLKNEKLFGFCKLCYNLCHDEDHCPLNPKSPEKKKESRDEPVGRRDDRSRSYKGVVINGEKSHHENGKDQRGYYGKGKGKMQEEQESKWVWVPERGNKRFSSYRNSNMVDEGNMRHRSSRWEQSRNKTQEDRDRMHRAQDVRGALLSMYETNQRKKGRFGKPVVPTEVFRWRGRNLHPTTSKWCSRNQMVTMSTW